MATVRATITRAMRKLRLLPAGGEPTGAEAADALSVIDSMFESWISTGVFGGLATKADPAQEVLEWGNPVGDTTVELPIVVRDEDGEASPPKDLSLAEVVYEATGLRKTFLYDARAAQWVRLDALTADDEMPLSERGGEGIAACVAMLMAEEYGAQIGPMVAREAGSFQRTLTARYLEKGPVTQAVYF